MVESGMPPIEVEIWARVGHSNEMHCLGTLEYPYRGPMNEEEFLVDFANQILERKNDDKTGT